MKGILGPTVVAISISSTPTASFAPASRRVVTKVTGISPTASFRRPDLLDILSSNPVANCRQLYATNDDHDQSAADDAVERHRRRSNILRLRSVASFLRHKSKPVGFALATAAGFFSCSPGQTQRQSLFRPPAAEASAPIVLRAAKKKDDPPMVQAMKKAEELRKQRSLEEFDRFMQKCNDIEATEGKKARAAYEKQYRIDEEAKKVHMQADIENLKRDLLDEGKDPYTDIDAENQVFKFEHDIDLEKVPGTPQNEQMIKNFQSRGKNVPTFASQRYIVKCQVADLKARGIDPLEHFAQPENMEKTRAIYKMDNKVAAKVAKQYEALMERNGGRLTSPKEGEKPFVRPSLEQPEPSSAQSVKELRAQAKAAAKAKRSAEKDAAKKERESQRKVKLAAKAKAKLERAEAKEHKLAEKKLAKQASVAAALAAKEATALTATSAQKAADSGLEATAGMDIAATAGQETAIESALEEGKEHDKVVAVSAEKVQSLSKSNGIMGNIKSKATLGNVATVVIGTGAAAYGFNYYKENNSAAESERQRQLNLIMGLTDDDDEDDEDDDDEFFDDDDDEDDNDSIGNAKPKPPQPKSETPKAAKPTPPVEPLPSTRVKPKRKLGIFSKKNQDARETDLSALIGPTGEAPEFASLLAKLLTFGASGRFPAISAMGDMPFEEFKLDEAKSMLVEKRSDLDLSDEQSAEIFASVVNCMIIDIVDLASSTLKGKDEKVTINAINVVMDFMDHAASLYDAVAKDVIIKPVTYGGNLGKKKLEQMFSIYAGSSMMSLDGGTTQDRIDTLQLVFAISDKKAEGLMQKSMMKMMMKMMKDGGKGLEGLPGMEGMEDMMAALGGGAGMPGMDGEISPEDLKQTVTMMKELMDSGQVSQEELAEVRKQFKEMYGSDISDLIKKAEQEGAGAAMGEDERELLDMFKRIMGE